MTFFAVVVTLEVILLVFVVGALERRVDLLEREALDLDSRLLRLLDP